MRYTLTVHRRRRGFGDASWVSSCGLIKRDRETPYYGLTEAGEEIARVLMGK